MFPFGTRRPDGQPATVGPIQNIKQLAGHGTAQILVWPNASPNRPPGTELLIDIKPLPFRSLEWNGAWVE